MKKLILLLMLCCINLSFGGFIIEPWSFDYFNSDPNKIKQELTEELSCSYSTEIKIEIFLCRMKYRAIADSYGVPIVVMEKEEFKEKYLNKEKIFIPDKDYQYVMGLFLNRPRFLGGIFDKEKWPSTFIYIDPNNSDPQKMSIFFHELGHYLCHKNKCECTKIKQQRKGTNVISEYHAFENELRMALEYNLDEVLLCSYLNMVEALENKWDVLNSHTLAIRMLSNSYIWQETEKKLGIQYQKEEKWYYDTPSEETTIPFILSLDFLSITPSIKGGACNLSSE